MQIEVRDYSTGMLLFYEWSGKESKFDDVIDHIKINLRVQYGARIKKFIVSGKRGITIWTE